MRRYSKMQLQLAKLDRHDIDLIALRYRPQIDKFIKQHRHRDVERFEGIMLDEVQARNHQLASDQIKTYLTTQVQKGRAVVLVQVLDHKARLLAVYAPMIQSEPDAHQLRISKVGKITSSEQAAAFDEMVQVAMQSDVECFTSKQRVDHITDSARDDWKRLGSGLEAYFLQHFEA